MSLEQPRDHDHPPQSTDDPFWTTLFDQEESNVTPEIAENGDFTWQPTDNGDDKSKCARTESGDENPWQTAQTLYDEDELIDLRVTGHNKGGLLVRWHSLKGFIPASQLIDFPQFHLELERINALKAWHERELRVKIIEVDPQQNRLIFSERAALVGARDRKRLLDEIEIGEELAGEITNLTKFGAFIDLGGVEGLIHISELSWGRVTHPSEIVKPGQTVRVRVLSVDPANGRVALSLKRLKSDPWQTVESRFEPGQLVNGRVSKVVSFGAFILIEDELEGLIHISELAEGTFLHPRNVVAVGQPIRARVLHVNGAEKRLALSLRGISG